MKTITKILQLVAFMASMLIVLCSVPATAAEVVCVGGTWESMTEDSYEGTPESAFSQCQRAAGKSIYDALSPAKCHRLKADLEQGKCEVMLVPDGISFALMSSRDKTEAKKPTVVGPVCKKLGRDDDLATVCDLGDDVTAYFFRGETRSCGNLAFTFTPQPWLSLETKPQPPETEPVADVESPDRSSTRKCRGKVQIQQDAGIQVYVPGRDLLTCSTILRVPAMNVSIPASNNVASKSKTPCN